MCEEALAGSRVAAPSMGLVVRRVFAAESEPVPTEIGSHFMKPHLDRAVLLYQQGRHELAAQELRQLIAHDPHHPYPHALLALVLADHRQLEEATREARQAIHLAPDFAFAHYAHARVLNERNREPEALEAINEAIRLDPADADYAAVQAAILFDLRRWPEALEAAERGLQLDAEHVGCANLRAMALVKLGRRDEAGQSIATALSKDPDNAITHANQGWTRLHAGDPRQALEHFREALRLEPGNEWARAGIVEALKARNVIYAAMLKYFLWMGRLSPGAQWGIILGGYFLSRILASTARTLPGLAPLVLPLRILYVAFALMTWLAYPLFNLLLRLNRFGRLALTRDQIIESNWVGLCLLLALFSLGGCLAQGFNSPWVISLAVFGLLLMPLSGVFRCSAGWPRKTMLGVTLSLLAIGLLAIGLVWQGTAGSEAASQEVIDQVGGLLGLFAIGVLGSAFLANYLGTIRPRV